MRVTSTTDSESRHRGLRDFSPASYYHTGKDDLVTQFYIPSVSASIRYDRTAGYFDTLSFALAAGGIAEMVENGGRIRLVVSPRIRKHDARALLPSQSDDVPQLEETLGTDDFRATFVRSFQEDRFAATSWLVDRNILEVKIAYVENKKPFSHYHEKLGVFVDRFGNRIAFTGSINETGLAWDGNFESIDVYRSWVREDLPRLERKEIAFDELWNGRVPGISVVSVNEARDRGLGLRYFVTATRKKLSSAPMSRLQQAVPTILKR